MAQTAWILMFPRYRRSELEKEVEEKRKKFDHSYSKLQTTLKKKSRPVQFIKDHPKLILGSATALLTSTKTLKFLLPLLLRFGFLKWGWKFSKNKLGRKAMKLGGVALLKTAFPLLKSLLKELKR